MHPRNPYQNPPDFNDLAQSYPKLQPYLISDPKSRRTTIDFQDEEAQRRLTEAIMHRDFNVNLHIPLTRLCPPVPNRMNYALWIQDIVRAHEHVLGPLSHSIRGIDIGTGATAIYPFLICKLEPTWEMIATELDEESYEAARTNVVKNGMDSRIHVQKATPNETILFPLKGSPLDQFEFAMCNPPFYASAEEVAQSAQDKERPPNAVCTGADIEMIYSNGGEEGFVGKILEESSQFHTRCKWYTSMLGKMSSVSSIVERLRRLSITNYGVTEFVQGQTRRWAIAWSFTDCHLPDTVSRIPSIGPTHSLYSSMPPKTTLVQSFTGYTAQEVCSSLSNVLGSIEKLTSNLVGPREGLDKRGLSRPMDQSPLFLVEAQGNTWSRSARRSRKREPQAASLSTTSTSDSVSNPTVVSDSKPALTCSCRVAARGGGSNLSSSPSSDGPGATVDDDPRTCMVVFQWIFGQDRSVFESFVGHVSRKVGSALHER